MRVVFVRHGESEANVAGIISDDPTRSVALTPTGHAQADSVAEVLRGRPFVAAYASQFLRTQQTAKAILVHHSCRLQFDDRINERRSGMDGQPTENFRLLVQADRVNVKPPRGESFREQMARLRDFLDTLAAHHATETVLAVSHEDPILAARAVAGAPPEVAAYDSIPNCGIVEIDWPRVD